MKKSDQLFFLLTYNYSYQSQGSLLIAGVRYMPVPELTLQFAFTSFEPGSPDVLNVYSLWDNNDNFQFRLTWKI